MFLFYYVVVVVLSFIIVLMFICMTSLSMLNFSRLNQRKLLVMRSGDVFLSSDVMGAGGGGGGSTVHGDVHRASFSSHLCSCLPGDQNSSTQERRPDGTPQGHVGNE